MHAQTLLYLAGYSGYFYYLDLGLPSVQSTVCKCINYVNFVKIIINRGIRLIVSNIFVNTVYFVFGSQKKVLNSISGLIIRLREDLKCLAEIFFHDWKRIEGLLILVLKPLQYSAMDNMGGGGVFGGWLKGQCHYLFALHFLLLKTLYLCELLLKRLKPFCKLVCFRNLFFYCIAKFKTYMSALSMTTLTPCPQSKGQCQHRVRVVNDYACTCQLSPGLCRHAFSKCIEM